MRVFVVNASANFTVVHLTICEGHSDGGSAILNLGSTVNLTNDLFSGNTASTCGGAIYNSGGTINADNCAFGSNTAAGDGAMGTPQGGAIYNNIFGTVNALNCSFDRNQAWLLCSLSQQMVPGLLGVPSTIAAP